MTEFSESQKTYMNDLFVKISDTFNKKAEEIHINLKTEIAEIRQDIQQFGKVYEDKIKLLETQNQQLKESIGFLQKKVRKNNLLIFGMPNSDNNLWDSVIHLFKNTLQVDITETDFNEIYKIGRDNNNSPVIVELISYQKKLLILKNTHKLKGTSVRISQDLSPEDRANHKLLVKHMQEAKNKGLKSYIRGQKLVIGGDTYTLRQLENRETTSPEILEPEDSEDCQSAPSTPNPQKRQKRLLKELGFDEVLEQQDNKKSKPTINSKSAKPGKPSAVKTRSNTALAT